MVSQKDYSGMDPRKIQDQMARVTQPETSDQIGGNWKPKLEQLKSIKTPKFTKIKTEG